MSASEHSVIAEVLHGLDRTHNLLPIAENSNSIVGRTGIKESLLLT